MAWQYTSQLLPFIGILFSAMIISAALALYTVVERTDALDEPSVRAFVSLNVGCSLWSGAYALQLLSLDIPTKRVWLGVAFVGAVLVSLSCFFFAVAYSGNEEWLSRRTLLVLAIEPAVAFVLYVTQYRHLYEQPLETAVAGDLVVLDRTFGPMAIIHVLFLYGLLVVGAGFLLKTVYESQHVYREQAVAVLFAILVPLVANIVWFLGLGPIGDLDLTPIAFTVSGLAFAVAIYRHHLLDIAPVARTAVVEDMRDGFLVIDETNRIRDGNAAARRSLSSDGAIPLVGRDVIDVFPEIAHIVGNEASTGQTEIVVDADDGRQFFDVQVQRLSNADGIRLLLLRDVTQQHAVEQRYQSFIENASDLITMVDDRGIIRYQSPSSRSVLGFEPSTLMGQSAFEFVHPDDRERIVEQFQTGTDASIAVDRAEYRLRTADGEWRDVETVGSNLLDDPFVDGIVLNTRDITERKKREREIRRANEQLEQFASVVSHDLRNPLNVAQGYLEVARESVDCASHDEIATAHERMETIIEEVLVLARAGQSIGDTERLHLEHLADRAWVNVDTAEATLSVAGDREIVADGDRVLHLFENLFRNAVEHGSTNPASHTQQDAVEHGGNTVTVRVGTTPDGFFVEDDGPGIPLDERESVLEYGHTTSSSGSGFGLAIVSKIADGHGWAIQITESADGGARFEFDTDGAPWSDTTDRELVDEELGGQ
ncbi:HTR-like protein [Natrinema sp. CBA1119]|uniref:histidine kinase N-terminal 7TM domain-containing protein n=1 Tax=Natrinema sp. CBA1119 TaxID=1608465 RepID=UPI000BF80782|nr:histidine kinase N-terminal 7TM domain-containing protein [Natrinema sp. CBA1119]PGF16521.1 HTR-like protein [Natrinema sp. CBA1119]